MTMLPGQREFRKANAHEVAVWAQLAAAFYEREGRNPSPTESDAMIIMAYALAPFVPVMA